MDKSTPRRPWWRRKRFWIAAVFLFATAWPAAVGPVIYATHVGWLPNTARRWHRPTTRLIHRTPLGMPYARYATWWTNLRLSRGYYTVRPRADGSPHFEWHDDR